MSGDSHRHELLTQDVIGCARCEGDHQEVVFRPLMNAVKMADAVPLTHWASCPVIGEPILMAMVEKPK